MSVSDGHPHASLADEVRSAIGDLERARRDLRHDDMSPSEEVLRRLERMVSRIGEAQLDRSSETYPLLLALIDELETTVRVFDEERLDLRERLRSTSRSMAAGAAYLRAREKK